VPFSEERLPPFKSGDQSSGHLGFRSKASCHAFIVPNTTGERTTTDMTVPTGLAVSRDQPLAFASDIGGKRLRQDTRGGLGDEPEETYASALDPWPTSCLPWFSPSSQHGRTVTDHWEMSTETTG
jgi:hypothetical protein